MTPACDEIFDEEVISVQILDCCQESFLNFLGMKLIEL